MSRSFIHLQFDDDHDGTGNLLVEAQCGKFGGESAAYFSIREIEAFAARIGEFPVSTTPRPEIRGGYYSEANDGSLSQELVGLAVYPTSVRGSVAIQVRLMTDLWNDHRPESQSRAVFEVPVTYEALREFSRELAKLVHGEVSEVRIESDPDGG